MLNQPLANKLIPKSRQDEVGTIDAQNAKKLLVLPGAIMKTIMMSLTSVVIMNEVQIRLPCSQVLTMVFMGISMNTIMCPAIISIPSQMRQAAFREEADVLWSIVRMMHPSRIIMDCGKQTIPTTERTPMNMSPGVYKVLIYTTHPMHQIINVNTVGMGLKMMKRKMALNRKATELQNSMELEDM